MVVSIDILYCQQITSWFEFVSCALEATARGAIGPNKSISHER